MVNGNGHSQGNGNGNGGGYINGNGNGYTNGNGNGGVITPAWKIIGIPITACMGIVGFAGSVMTTMLDENNREIELLRSELSEKTDQRYRTVDAERDFRYVEQRLHKVEEHDKNCDRRMNEHIKGHK